MRIVITSFWFLVLMSSTTYGQINTTGLDPFGNPILVDTTYDENDTIINKNGFFSLFKGKPGKAALYSLIIPSGGQIYNKRWWKVPLALGIDGGLTYVLIHNKNLYKETQALYLKTLKIDPKGSLVGVLRQKRDYYQKYSEYAWIWLIGGHLMTVIDAYVDRHLMDFDVSPDLSIQNNPMQDQFSPSPILLSAGIKVNLSPIRNKNSFNPKDIIGY